MSGCRVVRCLGEIRAGRHKVLDSADFETTSTRSGSNTLMRPALLIAKVVRSNRYPTYCAGGCPERKFPGAACVSTGNRNKRWNNIIGLVGLGDSTDRGRYEGGTRYKKARILDVRWKQEKEKDSKRLGY